MALDVASVFIRHKIASPVWALHHSRAHNSLGVFNIVYLVWCKWDLMHAPHVCIDKVFCLLSGIADTYSCRIAYRVQLSDFSIFLSSCSCSALIILNFACISTFEQRDLRMLAGTWGRWFWFFLNPYKQKLIEKLWISQRCIICSQYSPGLGDLQDRSQYAVMALLANLCKRLACDLGG